MLDALTLDQVRMFVTVAQAGSFRAGATRVLRAQWAVSHAIANLETQLDVRLFDPRRFLEDAISVCCHPKHCGWAHKMPNAR